MALKQLNLPQADLATALNEAVEPLLYPSETDAPITVHTFTAEQVGESFSESDILRLLYPEGGELKPAEVTWAELHRADSNGTKFFFRELQDVITIQPDNAYRVQEAYHIERAPKWRKLYDLLFDNTVDRRWFRVELQEPDNARKDIHVVGRHLNAQVEDTTNETVNQLGDWFVLSTYVIET